METLPKTMTISKSFRNAHACLEKTKNWCRPPTQLNKTLCANPHVLTAWLHKEPSVHFQFAIPFLMCLWGRWEGFFRKEQTATYRQKEIQGGAMQCVYLSRIRLTASKIIISNVSPLYECIRLKHSFWLLKSFHIYFKCVCPCPC